MDLPDKSDGDTYSGPEFTELKNEPQNMILAAGLALAGNSIQLKQAVARFVANASNYTENGAVDAYALVVIGLNDSPSALIDGMSATFKASNTNTGASTLVVAGLPSKSIKKNGNADALSAGDIEDGKYYSCTYDLADDSFDIAALSDTISGGIITSSNFTASAGHVEIGGIYLINWGSSSVNADQTKTQTFSQAFTTVMQSTVSYVVNADRIEAGTVGTLSNSSVGTRNGTGSTTTMAHMTGGLA